MFLPTTIARPARIVFASLCAVACDFVGNNRQRSWRGDGLIHFSIIWYAENHPAINCCFRYHFVWSFPLQKQVAPHFYFYATWKNAISSLALMRWRWPLTILMHKNAITPSCTIMPFHREAFSHLRMPSSDKTEYPNVVSCGSASQTYETITTFPETQVSPFFTNTLFMH